MITRYKITYVAFVRLLRLIVGTSRQQRIRITGSSVVRRNGTLFFSFHSGFLHLFRLFALPID